MKKAIYFKKMTITLSGAFIAFVFLSILIKYGIINRYYTGILISFGINVILAVSLNVTTGFLGQLTLGHAGFMAVGAYCAAFISKNLVGLPDVVCFMIALTGGGLMAMLIGALVCLPTLRLKGDYLAIITLAFGEVIKNILLNLSFLGGANGYIGIPRFTDFGWTFWLAVITVLATLSLMRSRFGRVITSIRDDEIASEATGIAISRFKLLAFIFAAFFAGIAGGLYAHYMSIIEPRVFDIDKSIEILVMVVLGGMGNVPGCIIAAGVLTILPEFLRGVDNLRMLLYAIALIVIMLCKYNPNFNRLIHRWRNKLKGADRT